MKKALCIGRDSKLWEEMLSSHKYSVTVVTNSEASKVKVLKEFHKLISSLNDGDTAMFTFSGVV